MNAVNRTSPSGLRNLQEALNRLCAAGRDKEYQLAFLVSIERYLETLCLVPNGEALLKEYGDYLVRHTELGTKYAETWQRAQQRLPHGFGSVLQQPSPTLAYAAGLQAVSDEIQFRLTEARQAKLDLLSRNVELPEYQAQESQIDENEEQEIDAFLSRRMLTEEVCGALEDWHSVVCDLLFELGKFPSDGCRSLFHIRRDGRDCLEARGCSTLHTEIKAAAEFLVERLSCEMPEEPSDLPPDDDSGDWLEAGKLREILKDDEGDLAFPNHKKLMAFLEDHQEVPRRRPKTKKGTPNPHRLEVRVGPFMKAWAASPGDAAEKAAEIFSRFKDSFVGRRTGK